MTVIDSDIIIYSALPQCARIRDYIMANDTYVSAVSRVEVLGFQRISESDLIHFESFFDSTTILSVTDEVIDKAVELRQQRKINLGDTLIAATALVNNFALLTNNTKDFKWINSLDLIDPFEDQ